MDIQKVMRRALAAAFVVLLAVIAVRADIYSAPLRGGDRCQRCDRELISQNVAAQIVVDKYIAHPYRTISCLLTRLRDEGDVPADRIYAADYNTGRFVPVAQAHFVRVPIAVLSDNPYYGTGAFDYVAFRSRAAAARLAERHGTSPLDWAAVREAGAITHLAHAGH